MKKLLYITLFVSLISSCKEEPPLITFNTNVRADRADSTWLLTSIPAAQVKNSLLEDYTGVKCPNCPTAHNDAKSLSAANNGRMNILSMHPKGNGLAIPYKNFTGYQDFNLQEAAELMSQFGVNKNLPSIGLDRIVHPAKSLMLTNSVNDWSSTLTTQLAKATPLNINIENKILVGDSIMITCTITATSQILDSVYLTLVLLEDNIINPQEFQGAMGAEIDTFYVHNNLGRKFITSYVGAYIRESFEPGRVYRKIFVIPTDPLWKLDNCKILAFAHKSTIYKREIWHSVTQKVK